MLEKTWEYNDGGRSKYFKAERVGDCVTRAISIATGLDYKDVYDEINRRCKIDTVPKRAKTKSQGARSGVYRKTYDRYLKDLGWKWVPCMGIGTGCKVHLKKSELPSGTIICRLSRHLTAVIDGVVNDTYDCTREGTRCVYGYYVKNEK